MNEFRPVGKYINRKEKAELEVQGLKWCGCCKTAKAFDQFHKGNRTCKPCQRAKTNQWVTDNRDHVNTVRNQWREVNREAEREKDRLYREANRERIRERERERAKNKSPLQAVKKRLRDRVRKVMSTHGWKKQSATLVILGAEWLVVKAYLENQFVDGMSWENMGKWHIDHIIPLASANTIEEVEKLCHYTNLQPLWALDNMIKGSKTTRGKNI